MSRLQEHADCERAPEGQRGTRLPCHLNCSLRGTSLECTEVYPNVRHSTNGLLVCGQKGKAIYLLSSPVFWQQQLKGNLPPWTELTQEKGSLGGDT